MEAPVRNIFRVSEHVGLISAACTEPVAVSLVRITPEEIKARCTAIDQMAAVLNTYHRKHLGDPSRGVTDSEKCIIHDHEALFEHWIPVMAEFHLKNTDAIYNETFVRCLDVLVLDEHAVAAISVARPRLFAGTSSRAGTQPISCRYR